MFAPQCWNDPPPKSKIVAVSDWDERVSPRNELKHLSARCALVRSRPPSKNSDSRRACPVPSFLFAVNHGTWIVGTLTVAQDASIPAAFLQSPPFATGFGSRLPGAGCVASISH